MRFFNRIKLIFTLSNVVFVICAAKDAKANPNSNNNDSSNLISVSIVSQNFIEN